MKQLVILSGKGGTGKTSVAAAFAHLSHSGNSVYKAVLADADVDASNLELLLRPQRQETRDFTGGMLAIVNPQLCQCCGTCEQVCRFDAVIAPQNGDGLETYSIDPIACEGCAACVYQCPEEAIRMEPQIAGCWYSSSSKFGPLFHADLFPAQENSGKLVTLVKQNARLYALDHDIALIIVDGPPGIGCPVIAAAAGADLALIVAEPTISGVHDLDRIIQTTAHFRIPAMVVINKADIYPEGSQEIEAVCAEQEIELIGRIPFDPTITEAMMNGEPVTVYKAESPSSRAIGCIWDIISKRMITDGDAYARS